MRYLFIKSSLILVTVLLNFNASAQIVTVGSSASCDYPLIQSAINAGAQEIRVVNNQTFNENLYISQTVNIKGGYPDCVKARLDQPSGIRTQIDASHDLGYPAIRIVSTDDSAVILLTRLGLKNAEEIGGSEFRVGSGLYIEQSVGLVVLNDVHIHNNKAHNGAGMRVSGNALKGRLNVYLVNSKIYNNTANQGGGGVMCVGIHTYASITVQADSGIYENVANFSDGGGMLVNGCTVTITSGDDTRLEETFTGVVRNTATNDGGGIYASNGARIYFRGNSNQPATLAGNHADNHGGGIAAFSDSIIELNDALVWSNSAVVNGGGFYLDEDVNLLMSTSEEPTCWNQGMCSILALNTADLGGAIYQSRGSTAVFNKSHIYKNAANWGLVVYSREDGTAGTDTKFHNNMIYGHGNNAFDREDRYLFRGYEPVSMELIHNTISDNDIDDTRAIMGASLGATFIVKNSIIHNTGETVYIGSVSDMDADCVLVNEALSISGNNIRNQPPSFINPANNDFHISNGSEATDMCPSVSGFTHDIDGELRGFDDPIQNLQGPYDAGADETYASDIIFKNHFE